jgi:hypothetical protein
MVWLLASYNRIAQSFQCALFFETPIVEIANGLAQLDGTAKKKIQK